MLSFLCCVGAATSIDPDEPYALADRCVRLSFFCSQPAHPRRSRLDWIGAFLITAGLTLIIFVLSDGSIAPDGSLVEKSAEKLAFEAKLPGRDPAPGMEHYKQLSDVLYARWANVLRNKGGVVSIA